VAHTPISADDHRCVFSVGHLHDTGRFIGSHRLDYSSKLYPGDLVALRVVG
jgi:hypothetical protein